MARLSGLVAAAVLVLPLSVASHGWAQVITGPAGAITAPPGSEYSGKGPTLKAGEFMVGDMVLRRDHVVAPATSGPRAGFEMPSYQARLWEFGVIPVAFADSVSESRRQTFWDNCEMWASAGVGCIAWAGEPTFLYVTDDEEGCWSYVGMMGPGPQQLNLQFPGCWSKATAAHEIGHAFGMMHEQSRPDRDPYVGINYQNTEAGKEDNFDRISNGLAIGDYDFGSLMHYAKNAFSVNGQDTIVPKPGYESQASQMGQRERPSSLDLVAMQAIYRMAPIKYREYPLRPNVFTISTTEALEVMYAIDTYYIAPAGLNRSNGLSINGRPDFLGIAAWFFDVYINSRYAGLQPLEARYNVMANITQTDEWRGKHPGWASAVPIATGNRLPFDRSELLAVMEALDAFYRAPEGLQRPQGLSLNGSPDFLGISQWIVEIYMTARMVGFSPNDSFLLVVYQIMQTDEWRTKH